jgi:3-deoxy-D-manno-octulosonic-acid transferase
MESMRDAATETLVERRAGPKEPSRSNLVGWVVYALYNLAVPVLFPILVVQFLLKGIADRDLLSRWWERLGFVPRRAAKPEKLVWIHGASVGENLAGGPIVERLLSQRPDITILRTTGTRSGLRVITKDSGPRCRTSYVPLDYPLAVALALWRTRPKVLVLIETEIWPNLTTFARAFGAKILTVSGRVSDRGLRRWRRWTVFYRWILTRFTHVYAQSEADADRFRKLGAPTEIVSVCGNPKFDHQRPGAPGEIARIVGAMGSDVIVAGSTHPGEEEQILKAFRLVRADHPEARLVIAPRHVERGPEVCSLIEAAGFEPARRSLLGAEDRVPEGAVLVLDTVGELADAYCGARIAFVGGSLIKRGGHNILEPLMWGKPVAFGPHMHNFRDIRDLAVRGGVGFEVSDSGALAGLISRFLSDSAEGERLALKAAALLDDNSGASQTCALAIARLAGGGP